jgi:hypothetical protein
MPKYPRKKKGKQPLRPKRGPDGRWLAPPPEPDPPDDQDGNVSAEDAPVTMGGLVIREPSPRPRAPEHRPEIPEGTRVSSQTGAIALRPAGNDRERELQRSRSHPSSSHASLPTSNERPKPKGRARVTVETETDDDAPPRPPRPPFPSPSSQRVRHEPMQRASPESEQRDSVLGIPAAHSSAQHGLREETQFHSVLSHRSHENTSRFSRNSRSIERVLREHAERAEARAQYAYEQNRAALDLISKSTDNVKKAFTEAKRARDRFNDLLSVSSRSRQSVRQRTNADSPSEKQAEREAVDGLRKVADYQRRVRSQVLGSDERRELQKSPVSSWRLRSGMYPASLSRLVEGQNASMDIGTPVSTAKNTPSDAPRDMNTHRMGVHEWVEHQRGISPQRPTPEEPDPPRQRAASPIARADEVLNRYGRSTRPPTALRRTVGERVSWLDQLNQPSTSRPYERDPPPHQPTVPVRNMATGAPGGPPSDSSLSSSTITRLTRSPPTPPTPRREGAPKTPSRDGARIPEYLRTHRAPTFEPVTPGGNMAPQTPNRRGAAAPAPAPMPAFDIPVRPRNRVESIGSHNEGHNRPARREAVDKITNMLSVAFVSEAQAAGRVDTVPLHKLGIKAALPKAYEGQSDQTSFENWLSLLLGFFRIHQLDVLNEIQDRARLEILGQVLKDSAHTYFRERHQKFLEQGESWDFREAILDLRDRYLYKNTPFMAARKFETLMQGNRDAQALYDDLSTQAARMVEHPSDYHFRLRFMLALRPEVLEYIIKTHSVSAENSTLAQIRSACEDFERSHEYGRQLAATQTRLGGSRNPGTQPTSRVLHNARDHSKRNRSSQKAQTSSQGNKFYSTTARPRGEEQSKAAQVRSTPKPDSKTKPANRYGQKSDQKKVSCFICGGDHYAKDCPPENRKAARGYAARISNEDAPEPLNDAASERHSNASNPRGENAQSPEPDTPGSDDDHGDSQPEGEQYDPDEVVEYPFSSSDESEPVYSRATRIVATSALNKIESRAAKASKPTPPKAHNIESNRARYKIGTGPQPQRDRRLQRCIEVTVPINGLPARVLLDGGSNTNMISPEFATVAKAPAIELQEQMTLQLAVMGSRSKINYGTWVPVEFGPVNAKVYFDIANIEGYDAILGTPFLWEYGVSPIYDNNGWIMRDGKRIHFPSQSSPISKSSQSFRN